MANHYVAQTATGTGSGADTSNYCSIANYNNGSKFTVGAGDTVFLNGTFTTVLTVTTSGTAGNVITYTWNTGAKFSTAIWSNVTGAFNCNGKNYLVLDGGSNGIIENTANGTGLANHAASNGIVISNSHDIEIKNLTIQNIYVHTLSSDLAVDAASVPGVYANIFGSNILIHNCAFTDVGWCIELLNSSAGISNLQLYSNIFTNYDHGVALGQTANMANPAGIVIRNNHFGTTANWDKTDNSNHHDGIHVYFSGTAGSLLAGADVYDNLFDGNWGVNNTAHIFMENDYNHVYYASVADWRFHDNVHIQYASNLLNNGFFESYGGSNFIIVNNTFKGSSVSLSLGVILYGATGTRFQNNIVTGVNVFDYFQNPTNTFASGGLNRNNYALPVAPGNSPYYLNNSAYSTISAWRTATGQEANSFTTDPSLGSDGSISAGSAAIGAGTNLTSLGISALNTSYNGLARPATDPWDVGAYQYAVAAPSASTATINSAGTSVAIGWSASVTNGADLTGMKITVNGVDYPLTYVSGSGSSTTNYSLASTIYQGAAGTNAYAQSGTGLVATSGGALINTYGSLALTNNSTQAIPAPSGPNALRTGSSTIDVSWDDNSLGVTSFIIYRCLDNASFVQVGTVAAGVVIYHDSSLASGTTYYYKIASTAQGVVSSQTSSVNATTTGGGAPSSSGMLGKVGLLGVAALK